jgi:hypothetical protein
MLRQVVLRSRVCGSNRKLQPYARHEGSELDLDLHERVLLSLTLHVLTQRFAQGCKGCEGLPRRTSEGPFDRGGHLYR